MMMRYDIRTDDMITIRIKNGSTCKVHGLVMVPRKGE